MSICSVAGWVASGLPEAGFAQTMPILMCHGSEDRMVPIDVGRRSCALLNSLAYSGATFTNFQGLGHQLVEFQFGDIVQFLLQTLPDLVEPNLLSWTARPVFDSMVIWLQSDGDGSPEHEEDQAMSVLREKLPWARWVLPWEPGWEASAAQVQSLVREASRAHGIPSGRVVLGGFGRGGALALEAGLDLESELAGIVTIAGWVDAGPHKVARHHQDTLILMLHGTDDEVVPFETGRKSRMLLESIGCCRVMFTGFTGLGHALLPGLWQ
ncbi:unnamed protein product, partial [Polarella glacialis]